jgi:hypothetical protein
MFEELDHIDVSAFTSDLVTDIRLQSNSPSRAIEPELPTAPVEICIERDLAVQLIGSDAGKARRMRPHGAMTQGASPVEIADVGALMEPFLRDEIRRVHEDKNHRPKISMVRATPQQALALKSFCQHFATYLVDHLGKNAGDKNAYRSQQRLNQANRVIDQINRGLGLRSDHAQGWNNAGAR